MLYNSSATQGVQSLIYMNRSTWELQCSIFDDDYEVIESQKGLNLYNYFRFSKFDSLHILRNKGKREKSLDILSLSYHTLCVFRQYLLAILYNKLQDD